MLKATNKKRLVGIILGLTASLFLVVHMVLLMFSDLTREYHGFWIWIVVGVIVTIAVWRTRHICSTIDANLVTFTDACLRIGE